MSYKEIEEGKTAAVAIGLSYFPNHHFRVTRLPCEVRAAHTLVQFTWSDCCPIFSQLHYFVFFPANPFSCHQKTRMCNKQSVNKVNETNFCHFFHSLIN